MINIVEELKNYLASHTDEEVRADWEKIKELTKDVNGPTVGEYLGGQYSSESADVVKISEIEDFVKDHIQSKIDHDELHLTGISLDSGPHVFEREFEIYKNALFEGIINGLIWAGRTVEGIECGQ